MLDLEALTYRYSGSFGNRSMWTEAVRKEFKKEMNLELVLGSSQDFDKHQDGEMTF